MTIDEFFGAKRTNIQKQVETHRNAPFTKGEVRKFEQENLKPDKLKNYAGKKPRKDELALLSIKLVFPSEEELEKFKRHFNVSYYIEPSVTDIKPLIALLNELEEGNIFYDKKTRTIGYR